MSTFSHSNLLKLIKVGVPKTLTSLSPLCTSNRTLKPECVHRHPYVNCNDSVRSYTSWMRSPFVVNMNGGRYKSKSNNGKELGETTILRESEGNEFQELPMAVHKHPEIGIIIEKTQLLKPYLNLDPKEEAAFVEGFSNFNTPQQILKMLDTIPSQEVTPFVSLSILKKLFELENNFWFRNEGKSWMISAENSTIETFARMAIVSRLVDTIITSDDPNIILDTLDTLRCERMIENVKQADHPFSTESNISNYRNKLFHEILVRVMEGKFSVTQVSRAVVGLGKIELECGKPIQADFIDKLWVGILDKSGEIDVKNIVEVFQTVQYFKKSRRLVLNLAEKKILSLWWKMNSQLVSEICSILIYQDTKFLFKGKGNRVMKSSVKESLGVSNRLLLALSRCASLNIHQVKEDELLQIIKAFDILNFCDESIEKAIIKYTKAKCLKISNPQLIAVILDYVRKFNIQCPSVLKVVAEYFVLNNTTNLSPPQVTSIITAFGHLNFVPPNGTEFWKLLEEFISERFIQFPTKDIIDILLSCVYLKKFPLNFVNRIFSPYFLDRVHANEKNLNELQSLRSNLKLLDTALIIECPHKYNGPLLPKNFTSRNVFIDGRILRISNYIEVIIQEVITRKIIIDKSVNIPGLPHHALYTADLLLSSKHKNSESERKEDLKIRISSRLANGVSSQNPLSNVVTAVLINIPEHYLKGGDEDRLIGSQIMRIRHLRAVGFNVVTLKYDTLSDLKVHPEPLKEYLKERLTKGAFTIN